jgi:hypothetical protein
MAECDLLYLWAETAKYCCMHKTGKCNIPATSAQQPCTSSKPAAHRLAAGHIIACLLKAPARCARRTDCVLLFPCAMLLPACSPLSTMCPAMLLPATPAGARQPRSPARQQAATDVTAVAEYGDSSSMIIHSTEHTACRPPPAAAAKKEAAPSPVSNHPSMKALRVAAASL